MSSKMYILTFHDDNGETFELAVSEEIDNLKAYAALENLNFELTDWDEQNQAIVLIDGQVPDDEYSYYSIDEIDHV